MKQPIRFISILSLSRRLSTVSCLTIYQTMALATVALVFASACSPGTNNSPTSNDVAPRMSGGVATKDPGDGTGGSTGDGGGGQGILCGPTKVKDLSNKLFVRDIYEAIYNHNRQLKNVSNISSDLGKVQTSTLKVLTDSIKQFYGPASRNLEFTKEHFWTQFIDKISFIDDDKKLYPSKDANSPIALPEGCEIIQIAYWDEAAGADDNGTLFVNKQLWQKLDQLNKAALLAHEYFFKLARKANYKNSDMVRFKVGQLFSAAGIEPFFNNWSPSSEEVVAESLPKDPHRFKYCQGTSEEDPTARLQFYQYSGSDFEQQLAIPLLRSSAINANPFQTTSFKLNTENTILGKATDLLLYQTYASKPGLNFAFFHDAWTNIWFNAYDFIWLGFSWDLHQNFNTALDELTQKNEILWTGYIPQGSNPIKVDLINPAFKRILKSDQILKSREDLILEIHTKIEDAIKACSGPIHSMDEDALTAITVLDKEISGAIAEEKYPDFLVWRLHTSKIAMRYSAYNFDSCAPLYNDLYIKKLPDLLYKVFTRSYSKKDIESTLETKGDNDENTDRTTLGRLKVSQGNNSINFDLKCRDYADIYSDIKNEHANLDATASIIPKKTVTVSKEIAYSKNLRIFLRSQEALSAFIKQREIKFPTELPKIHEVSEFLKFDKNNYKDLFDRFYSNQQLQCKNERSSPAFESTCKQFEYFIKELKTENELKLSPCELFYNNNRNEIDHTCMIVTMKRSSNRYKVFFNKGYFLDDDEPKIDYYNFDFVKLIPN